MKTNVLSRIFAALFLLGSLSLNAQQEVQIVKNSGPVLEFVDENMNLGQLKTSELETFDREIEFVNNGDQPLIVSQVRGCCGTRIMDWPREPISPGEKGIIKIQFRLAPRAHNVNRVITVVSNQEGGQKVFRIIGEVVDAMPEIQKRQ